MRIFKLALRVIPVAAIGFMLSAPANAFGWFWWRAHDFEVIEYDEAELFFELNDTDKDLGIHALIDGEGWKFLSIKDTHGRNMLSAFIMGRLRQQGLTEIFFESAEPTFDVLDPDDFFDRFPEGDYLIRGRTLEGDKLLSETELTHVIPAAPANIEFNGEEAPEDCDADLPEVTPPIVVTWDPTTTRHAELGDDPGSDDIAILYQTFVVETEIEVDGEDVEINMQVQLPPDVDEYEIPEIYTDDVDEVKIEILAREDSFNQSAVETCVAIAGDD